MQKYLVATILVLALSGSAYAESLFGARNPYQFKSFRTQRGLNQAIIMYQVKNDGIGTRVKSTNTTNVLNSQSTAADSISNITVACGTDAQCLVDALFTREGNEGGSVLATTTQGSGEGSPTTSSAKMGE